MDVLDKRNLLNCLTLLLSQYFAYCLHLARINYLHIEEGHKLFKGIGTLAFLLIL